MSEEVEEQLAAASKANPPNASTSKWLPTSKSAEAQAGSLANVGTAVQAIAWAYASLAIIGGVLVAGITVEGSERFADDQTPYIIHGIGVGIVGIGQAIVIYAIGATALFIARNIGKATTATTFVQPGPKASPPPASGKSSETPSAYHSPKGRW